jgi:hypothetical protein
MSDDRLKEWTPVSLAQHFHEIYERLASTFGYETRTETRSFDPETPNGKLMVAVCTEILRDINAAIAAEQENCFKSAEGGKMSEQPKEWRVERSKEGVDNSMARIMQGDKKIIGWTMRPYSESFQKICDAHNAALAAEHEQVKRIADFAAEVTEKAKDLQNQLNEANKMRKCFQRVKTWWHNFWHRPSGQDEYSQF